MGSTSNNNSGPNAENIGPLKYLSNFWTSLDLLLINCETELDLTRSKYCVISEVSRTFREVNPNVPPVVCEVATETTRATSQINNVTLYVPVVLFSINYNIKVLENIKQGFKRTICLNKYISEITTQTKKNKKKQKTKLDYPIDPAFRDVNRLFVFSFRNGDDDPIKNSFDEYYMPLVKIKDFNVLIENTLFFDEPVKKETRSI